MALAEKMFTRSSLTCPMRSDCKGESDRRYFDTLFEGDWEVFVIRRDNDARRFEWFTLCCDAAEGRTTGFAAASAAECV
jgi:hypothetical protein